MEAVGVLHLWKSCLSNCWLAGYALGDLLHL